MNNEVRKCQNCKNEFVINQEDFNYYEKVHVPAPTWCPKCRVERRLASVDTWSVYWRVCDKCGKKTFSMYPQDKEVVVYCPHCFWADDWDGTEYGMDYNPNRNFFEQIKELSKKVPMLALDVNYVTVKNSDYSNGLAWGKNCYMTFWADYAEDLYYCTILKGLKHSADCIRGYDSELCYESVGFSRCYNVYYSDQCDDCLDAWFCRDCYGCSKCVGCVNLRGASYCIFNRQYSKDEYSKKLEEFKLDTREGISELRKKAFEFWLTKPYREYNGHSLNYNVTGEHIYTSKNVKEGFIVNGTENSKYCQFITVPQVKDCMDYSGWGNNVELLYECTSVGENASNNKFCAECFPDCMNLEYCQWCIAVKNALGCISLKRKHYAILNKIYPKEEFLKLKEKIIEDINKNPYIDEKGRIYKYGEFFPPEMSQFPYNKSTAMRFFPKTKEKAITEGYLWRDEEEIVHSSAIKTSTLSSKIADTSEDIVNEIIECSYCKRGYKITKGEFDLLRKMKLPIPHECPKCRENARFSRMTIPGMYHRKCQKCGIEIYTPYSEKSNKIVYCIKCYQLEFA